MTEPQIRKAIHEAGEKILPILRILEKETGAQEFIDAWLQRKGITKEQWREKVKYFQEKRK